jgi:hypothetical protein
MVMVLLNLVLHLIGHGFILIGIFQLENLGLLWIHKIVLGLYTLIKVGGLLTSLFIIKRRKEFGK